jgi:hypothetical protein
LSKAVKIQCAGCNDKARGNGRLDIFAAKLGREIGLGALAALVKEKHRPVKITEEEFRLISDYYRIAFNQLREAVDGGSLYLAHRIIDSAEEQRWQT